MSNRDPRRWVQRTYPPVWGKLAAPLRLTACASAIWPNLQAHTVAQREPVWLAVQFESDYCYSWSRLNEESVRASVASSNR